VGEFLEQGAGQWERRVAMAWGLCRSGRMCAAWLEAGREFGSK
jgi:hypothetical protein